MVLRYSPGLLGYVGVFSLSIVAEFRPAANGYLKKLFSDTGPGSAAVVDTLYFLQHISTWPRPCASSVCRLTRGGHVLLKAGTPRCLCVELVLYLQRCLTAQREHRNRDWKMAQ